MTAYDFKAHHSKNMRYIGTAGGWAKPSTGYTFRSTAKKTPKMLEHIKSGKPLNSLSYRTKFWYYDLLFIDVLFNDNAQGYNIFETLFKNRKPQQVFKFLDEETSFIEDVGNMMGSPIVPFTKALFRRLF
jgi:lycopene beta-cyclase